MKTTDLITSHIDLLVATAPRANASNIEVLMLARERIERLEAGLEVVVEQLKDNRVTVATVHNLEGLLCTS